MAKVILGGQALSLVLTLLVTPVAYSLFDGMGRRVRGLFGRAADEEPVAVAARQPSTAVLAGPGRV
jgi:HAE1 family hydrophobic/amphiphilic exporter-1